MVHSEPTPAERAPKRDQSALKPLSEPVTGTLLVNESDILAITLPSLKESVAWKRTGSANAHSIAGPDLKGRVALVKNDMMARRHWLLVIDTVTGNETELFSRNGDALWGDNRGHHPVGEALALSPTLGRLALQVNLKAYQITNPPAYMDRGPIEIWDMATRKRTLLPVDALDAGLSWFPDGRRLAFTRLVTPREAGRLDPGTDGFMSDFVGGSDVPVISILDIATGKVSTLCPGWNPLVSDDGRWIVAGDYEQRWRIVEVATGKSIPTTAKQQWSMPIALFGNHHALCFAEQDNPGDKRYTEHNSPLVGPKDMPRIVFAQLGSVNAQTVFRYIDPRWETAFGPGRVGK